MDTQRFDRNERLFGKDGQHKLRSLTVGVVGVGGLGTHVVQQLSYLGVGGLVLIDGGKSKRTNGNRYVGLYERDIDAGLMKVDIGRRLALAINSDIRVTTIAENVPSDAAFAVVRTVDTVFGCVDNDRARLIMNEFCSAYTLPYFDLASDVLVEDKLRYGGRVCSNVDGNGCLVCCGLLEPNLLGREMASEAELRDRERIYGVHPQALDGVGPSVVSINGIIASLGVTEFMLFATGVRAPQRVLTYRGQFGGVAVCTEQPSGGCFYCKTIRGRGGLTTSAI